MSPLVRLVLACLLALALPLQGLAAGLGVHCQGHGAAQAMQGHVQGHVQRHAASLHADAAEAAVHGHGPAEALADPAVTTDDGRCSACATCCTAGLPAAGLHAIAEPVLTAAPAALQPASATPFLTSGPERPPRAHLLA